MVLIAGFGNPLLDVIIHLDDNNILKKYNLKEDGEKEISKNEMKTIIDDLSYLKPVFAPGGCVQNTLRILQWVLGKPNCTMMFGGIGKDLQGKILKGLVEDDGVQTKYIEYENEATGTSLVLINGANRTLLAHIGAAQQLQIDNLQSINITSVLESIDVVYMEGFFLSHRIDVGKYIEEHCKSQNILFAFNLSGAYMIKMYPNDMLYFAQTCDILLGNRREFETLIAVIKSALKIEDFAMDLSYNYTNVKHLPYGKMVVITDGSHPIICCHSNGLLEKFNVPITDCGKIKDTNGAGDAFVAGFLGGLLNKRNPTCCLKWGCWVAHQIMQQIGCCTPTYSSEFLQNIHK